MDDTRRKRLAAVWVGFALLMAYVTLADGVVLGTSDLLGLGAVLLGAALAYVYYANPGGVLDFGSSE